MIAMSAGTASVMTASATTRRVSDGPFTDDISGCRDLRRCRGRADAGGGDDTGYWLSVTADGRIGDD